MLLGDSIFDNGVYVAGGPDVVRQLQDELPTDWVATLRAIDGDVTDGVSRQLRSLPADATHLVVSVGGNDALGVSGILQQPADTVGDGLLQLADVQGRFAASYEATTVDRPSPDGSTSHPARARAIFPPPCTDGSIGLA